MEQKHEVNAKVALLDGIEIHTSDTYYFTRKRKLAIMNMCKSVKEATGQDVYRVHINSSKTFDGIYNFVIMMKRGDKKGLEVLRID